MVTNSLDVAELKNYQKSVDILKYATATASEKSTEPYVIQAEQYGDEDDYETVTLNYYSEDSVVTYDNDDALSKADVHRMIGDTLQRRSRRLITLCMSEMIFEV